MSLERLGMPERKCACQMWSMWKGPGAILQERPETTAGTVQQQRTMVLDYNPKHKVRTHEFRFVYMMGTFLKQGVRANLPSRFTSYV